MRDYLSQKQESDETIHRKKDLVPNNFRRKAYANQLVKEAFVVSGDDSSESQRDAEDHKNVSMMSIEDYESVFKSIFSLKTKSDGEKDSNEVTLFEFKDDLGNLPTENWRKLVALLIDYVDERSTQNIILNEKLSFYEDENTTL